MSSWLHTCGISYILEILPFPIAAIFILLLGAFLPNTLAGTMLGMLASIIDEAVACDEVFMNFLLDICFFMTVLVIRLI